MKRIICTALLCAVAIGTAGCETVPSHYREVFPNHWLDRPAFDGAEQTLRDAIRETLLVEKPYLADDPVRLESEIDAVYAEYAVDIQKAQKAAKRMQTRIDAARALGMLLRGFIGGG